MNETNHEPVSIQYIAREVEMYSLTKSEILSLKSSDGGLEVALACATGGIFASVLITLLTVPIGSPAIFASFVGCAFMTAVLCVYFALQSILAKRKMNEHVTTILERTIDRPSSFRAMNHHGA